MACLLWQSATRCFSSNSGESCRIFAFILFKVLNIRLLGSCEVQKQLMKSAISVKVVLIRTAIDSAYRELNNSHSTHIINELNEKKKKINHELDKIDNHCVCPFCWKRYSKVVHPFHI